MINSKLSIHSSMVMGELEGSSSLYIYLIRKRLIILTFFLSEALEKDKHKYYRFLNDTRYKGDWNQWIKFFSRGGHTSS